MVDITLNTLLRNYARVTKLLIIPLNIGLIYWFVNHNTSLEYYLIISLIVLFNVHFVYFLKFKENPKESSLKINETILSLIDEVPYAEPENVNDESHLKDSSLSSADTIDIEDLLEKSIETSEQDPDNNNDSLYDKPIEVNDYLDRLVQYLSDHGFSVPKDTVRETFAGMAATRFMVFANSKPETIKAYVDCFSAFIGAKLFSDSIAETFQNIKDPKSLQKRFNVVINAAERNPNHIHIKLITVDSFNGFPDFINQLIREHFEPFPANKRQTIHLPDNIWFILVPSANEKGVNNKVLHHYSMPIEVTSKPLNSETKPTENSLKLSYEHMNNLFSGAYDQYFLEEETWKKLDELELYINQYSTFRLSNPFIRQLERFTSIYFMFNGDKKEVIDILLYGKILPLVTLKDISNQTAFYDETLKQIDKWFGLETLTRSKKWLKKQIKVAEKND